MAYVFDNNRFDIAKFYSYPCCVVNRTAEYEENGFHGTRGDVTVKEFFEAVLKAAQEITGRHLMDNKIAFEVIDNIEKKTFYVGYKDNIYAVGDSLNPYMNSCYVYDLKTCTKKVFPSRVS